MCGVLGSQLTEGETPNTLDDGNSLTVNILDGIVVLNDQSMVFDANNQASTAEH